MIKPLDNENSIFIITNVITNKQYLENYINTACNIKRHQSKFMGRDIPRSQICYTKSGQCYQYSGVRHKTVEFPPYITELFKRLMIRVQQIIPDNPYTELDTATDLMYSNKYVRGGSIGEHKDDENINWGLVIVYSLGQTRYMRIRKNKVKNEKNKFINVAMPHNSLIGMYGPNFQQLYTHRIDKLKIGEPVGNRLSLNGRYIKI